MISTDESLLFAIVAVISAAFGEAFKVSIYFLITACSFAIITITYTSPVQEALVRVCCIFLTLFFFIRIFVGGNSADMTGQK